MHSYALRGLQLARTNEFGKLSEPALLLLFIFRWLCILHGSTMVLLLMMMMVCIAYAKTCAFVHISRQWNGVKPLCVWRRCSPMRNTSIQCVFHRLCDMDLLVFVESLFYFSIPVLLTRSFQRMPYFLSYFLDFFFDILVDYCCYCYYYLFFFLCFFFFSLSDCFHIIFDSFLSHYSFSESRCFFIHLFRLSLSVVLCITVNDSIPPHPFLILHTRAHLEPFRLFLSTHIVKSRAQI